MLSIASYTITTFTFRNCDIQFHPIITIFKLNKIAQLIIVLQIDPFSSSIPFPLSQKTNSLRTILNRLRPIKSPYPQFENRSLYNLIQFLLAISIFVENVYKRITSGHLYLISNVFAFSRQGRLFHTKDESTRQEWESIVNVRDSEILKSGYFWII